MSKNNNTKMLEGLVKTRAVLKEKLKTIKLNQRDTVNSLEDTFQPITKPFKNFIGKNKNKDMYKLIYYILPIFLICYI